MFNMIPLHHAGSSCIPHCSPSARQQAYTYGHRLRACPVIVRASQQPRLVPTDSGDATQSSSLTSAPPKSEPSATTTAATARTDTPTSSQSSPEAPTPTPSTPSTSSTSSTSSIDVDLERSTPENGRSLFSRPSTMRRVLLASSAAEAIDIMSQDEALVSELISISEGDCQQLLRLALERGNGDLALSVYKEMSLKRVGKGPSGSGSPSQGMSWPPCSLETTANVVLGLCQALRVTEALEILTSLRSAGVPAPDELSFGVVVASPLVPNQPLAVVQPQEGVKVVADAFSRYEYELFSGAVVSIESEDLNRSPNPFLQLARKLGVWKGLPVGAIHEFCVQAPDGTARTFRCGSETADVPAQKADRVTVVCAPVRGSGKYRKMLRPSPPGTRPGQPMSITNHKTKVVTELLRPPPSGTQPGLPSWALPAALLLASSDAATYLIDPTLPALVAAGAAAVAGSAIAGNQLMLPRMRQLQDEDVKVEYMRQRLLGQYRSLGSKVEAMVSETTEDLRTLARLWQLQAKMESVSGGGTYGARRERVAAACSNLEDRVRKQLELVDGYVKVMNMIEIEVEMEMEVMAAEFAGIEAQIDRLVELEEVQQDWKLQAEARDEVERLLRAA